SLFFASHYTEHSPTYTLSLHDALPISSTPATEPTCERSGPRLSSSTTASSPSRSRTRRARHRSSSTRRSVGSSSSTRPTRSLRRSEEHTSELQSHLNLVCRLLLEKKTN